MASTAAVGTRLALTMAARMMSVLEVFWATSNSSQTEAARIAPATCHDHEVRVVLAADLGV